MTRVCVTDQKKDIEDKALFFLKENVDEWKVRLHSQEQT